MSYNAGFNDVEQNIRSGLTAYRDLLTAERYTTWGDSIADGASPEWAQTNANGGTTTTVTGEGLIQTSANAAGAAQIVGPVIMYLPGQEAWFNSAIRFGDTGSAGNIRRFGVYTVSGTTPQDGFAFELDGTILYAASYKGGVVTRTASTSWTKFASAPFTVDTNFHSFELRFTTNVVRFYIDNVLRHTASGGATPITNTLNFPISATNINTSGATNRVLAVRNIGQGRFGTEPVGGRISVENSTTTTLAANGVFTGVPIDISGYGKVTVTAFSNVASATDGLVMQQSMDGVNWDLTDPYTSTAGVGRTYSVPKQGKYFRLVYTNGGTIQATNRIQTFLVTDGKGSSNRASDGYTNETDLEQTQTFPMVFNGATWDRIRGDLANGLDVDVTRLPAIPAGTNAIGTVSVSGSLIAHDAVDSGNPQKMGTKAIASLATATLVAAADRTDAYGDLDGTLITRNTHPLGDLKSDAVTDTAATSVASAVFTGVAATRNYIEGIHVFRTDAGTTPIFVDFRDGIAGAVLWRMVIPAGGGAVLPQKTGGWFRTTANTALAYDVSAATTTVYINVSGFQSKI